MGNGYPLVMVHGYLGGQDMWKYQEDLRDEHCLIMPSLAGYGESSTMQAPSTITENAQQVFNLLDSLGIEKFNLLGHSMGGMIVQEMASLFPSRPPLDFYLFFLKINIRTITIFPFRKNR